MSSINSSINDVTYISDVEQTKEEADEKSVVSLQQTEEKPLNLETVLQDKVKFLPVPYDFSHAVSVSRLLAYKYQTPFSEENYAKSRRELEIIMLGLIVFIFMCIVGWGLSKEINFLNGGGFVYNTGLMGGILMLLTFLHSFVKRSLYLSRKIPANYSYYFHVACGASGAMLIIMHSNFDFRSINSSVAVASMAFIIIAGALGRYLYTLFTLSLHRLYVEIKDMEPGLYSNFSMYNSKAAGRIQERLSDFVLRSFRQPGNIFSYLVRCFTLIQYSAFTYLELVFRINRLTKKASILSELDKDDVKKIKKSHKAELREYIYSITKMGCLNLLEQVFRHWRVLHIPFLYILVLTSVAHVVVVHMY